MTNLVVPLFLLGSENTRFVVIAIIMPATRFVMGQRRRSHANTLSLADPVRSQKRS